MKNAESAKILDFISQNLSYHGMIMGKGYQIEKSFPLTQ